MRPEPKILADLLDLHIGQIWRVTLGENMLDTS
jgi:hypothetical protein